MLPDKLIINMAHEVRKQAYLEFMRHKNAAKSIGAFDRQLWRAALDLFRSGDEFAFIDDFTTNIDAQLRKAWNEGARELGVDPRDFSEADQEMIEGIINSEYDHVLGLAQAIVDFRNDPENGGEEFNKRFRSRIDLWVNRYTETVNRAKMHFGGKQRYEWKLGQTEEHCETCQALNGIIAFADEWVQYGIKPQSPPNPILECQGWRCDCTLQATEKRRTIRARDRLTEIALTRAGGI